MLGSQGGHACAVCFDWQGSQGSQLLAGEVAVASWPWTLLKSRGTMPSLLVVVPGVVWAQLGVACGCAAAWADVCMSSAGGNGAPAGGAGLLPQWKIRVATACMRVPGRAPEVVVTGPLSTTVIISPVSRARTW